MQVEEQPHSYTHLTDTTHSLHLLPFICLFCSPSLIALSLPPELEEHWSIHAEKWQRQIRSTDNTQTDIKSFYFTYDVYVHTDTCCNQKPGYNGGRLHCIAWSTPLQGWLIETCFLFVGVPNQFLILDLLVACLAMYTPANQHWGFFLNYFEIIQKALAYWYLARDSTCPHISQDTAEEGVTLYLWIKISRQSLRPATCMLSL